MKIKVQFEAKAPEGVTESEFLAWLTWKIKSGGCVVADPLEDLDLCDVVQPYSVETKVLR